MTGANGVKELNKQTLEAAKLQNRLILESKKYTNSLAKLEIQAQKTALAAEKQTLSAKKHNDQLVKGTQNTNTWSKALGSFAFKFNFLGNAVAMLGGGFAKLGAIVGKQVLGAMTSFFTKTDEGMEWMERKVAGLTAAWNVFSAEIGKAGKAIADNNQEATKWGDVMKTTLKVLLSTATALPKVRGWIEKVGNDMNKAAKEAEEFTTKLQNVEDAEIANISVRSAANLEIQRALQLSRDETQSIEVREAALKKSMQIEDKALAKEIEINDLRVSALQDMKASYGQFFTDVHERMLQEALAKRDNLEIESIGRTKKAENKLNEFRKEISDKYTKEQKEAWDQRQKDIIDFNNTVAKQAETTGEEIKSTNEAFILGGEDLLESATEGITEYGDAIGDMTKNEAADYLQFLKDAKDAENELLDIAKERIEYESYGYDILAALAGEMEDKDLQSIDNKRNRDLANAQATITDKKKLAAEELRIEEEYQKKEKGIKRKYTLIQAAMDIAMVWVKTSASKAAATAIATPYLLNPITAAPMAAALALALANLTRSAITQTAAIGIQAGIVSKFAKGTDSSPEGVAWVGEQGRELMIDKQGNVSLSPETATLTYLKRGTKIIPADLTNNMLNSVYSDKKPKEGEKLLPVLREIANKPVTSVNIDSNGIGYITESKTTLTRRIDKYFRN